MTPTSSSRRRLRMAGALVATAALVLALAACGSDGDSDTATTDTTAADTSTTATDAANVVSDEGGLAIADPWARTSPMDTTYGAVYLTLTSEDGDALVGASVPSDIAGSVEIHETVASGDSADPTDSAMSMDGGDTTETTMAGMGQMTMQPIESLELPTGEAVILEPGGHHLMLIDLVAPLETGQEIEVTLTFENAGERTVSVPVRDDAP